MLSTMRMEGDTLISLQNETATLEEKIFELVCEYGALKAEQVKRYFDIDEEKLEKMAVRLTKKGRMKYDRQLGYVRMPVQKDYDENLIRCFWLVIDLKDSIEYHGLGKYPLYIAMYAKGKAYEVYGCRKGDEFALQHAIALLQEQTGGRLLVVVEDMEQIRQLNIEQCTYCMVDEAGEVKYFE